VYSWKRPVRKNENKTRIPTVDLASYCTELLKLVTQSPPSSTQLCRILRKSTLGDEIFDPVIHYDLRFAEKTLKRLYIDHARLLIL
jgi:hypothetical protein